MTFDGYGFSSNKDFLCIELDNIYTGGISMKLVPIICFVILTVNAVGCDKKIEPKIETINSPKVESTAKVQEHVEIVSKPVLPVKTNAQEIIKTPIKVGGNTDIKSKSDLKNVNEQPLIETMEHARKVTNTQVSEARQHSQNAEEEMLKMLEKK